MNTEKNTQIRVLPETREKLDAIASAKRWKLGVTVDVLADDFIQREGIKVPKLPRRRERQTA